jgi:hypothetical protein
MDFRGLGFRVPGECRPQDLGVRGWGLCSTGSGFRVWVSGFGEDTSATSEVHRTQRFDCALVDLINLALLT